MSAEAEQSEGEKAATEAVRDAVARFMSLTGSINHRDAKNIRAGKWDKTGFVLLMTEIMGAAGADNPGQAAPPPRFHVEGRTSLEGPRWKVWDNKSSRAVFSNYRSEEAADMICKDLNERDIILDAPPIDETKEVSS